MQYKFKYTPKKRNNIWKDLLKCQGVKKCNDKSLSAIKATQRGGSSQLICANGAGLELWHSGHHLADFEPTMKRLFFPSKELPSHRAKKGRAKIFRLL